MKYIATACLLITSTAIATTANLSWTAPTVYVDGSAIAAGALSFNVYQGLTGALTKVASGVTTSTTTLSAGLTAGTTQCFAVTAVANGIESAQSAQSCAAIPFSIPGVPTQITVVIH